MGVVVAAFDVDGTLTVRDCVVPFLTRVAGGRRRLGVRLASQPVPLVRAGMLRDRDDAKAAATRAVFTGRSEARVLDEGRAFAGIVATSWMRPDTVARLGWHLEQAHQVVLVSASYEVYVAPLGARIGASSVLATRLAANDDGRLSGNLEGPNCRAGEKVVRLRAWQAEQGYDAVELWAYGDSAGDDAMLAVADHAVRVGSQPISRVPEAV